MVFWIGDLCSDRGGVKQFHIVGVCLNQPTLNAAFQRGGKKQTEHNGHIPCNHLQQRHTCNIKRTVNYGQYNGDERHRQNLAAVWNTAFDQHGNKCCHGTKDHPSDCQKVSDGIMVIIHPYDRIRGKNEYELMQVIGQYQQQKSSGGYVKKRCPFRQAVTFRLSQRHGDKHRQQRNKQHGQIVQVPEMAHQPCAPIQ